MQFIRESSSTSGRLLEVGCAYGFSCRRQSAFSMYQGIELAGGRRRTLSPIGLNVFTGQADENFSAARHNDVIVLLDVIEHLPSPAKQSRYWRST